MESPPEQDIVIRKDFVSQDEETAVRDLVRQFLDPRNPRRQVVRFGTFHPCSDGTIVPSAEPLPSVLTGVAERLVAQGIVPAMPESMSLNIYPPTATILPHIDNPILCGPVINVVGLFEDNDILFKKVKGGIADDTETHHCMFPSQGILLPSWVIISAVLHILHRIGDRI